MAASAAGRSARSVRGQARSPRVEVGAQPCVRLGLTGWLAREIDERRHQSTTRRQAFCRERRGHVLPLDDDAVGAGREVDRRVLLVDELGGRADEHEPLVADAELAGVGLGDGVRVAGRLALGEDQAAVARLARRRRPGWPARRPAGRRPGGHGTAGQDCPRDRSRERLHRTQRKHRAGWSVAVASTGWDPRPTLDGGYPYCSRDAGFGPSGRGCFRTRLNGPGRSLRAGWPGPSESQGATRGAGCDLLPIRRRGSSRRSRSS